MERVRGITELTLVQELGQPRSPLRSTREDRAIRHQRRGRQRLIEAAVGGDGGDTGGAGREAVRSRRAAPAAVPRDAGGDRQHPRSRRRPASRSRSASWRPSPSRNGAAFIYRRRTRATSGSSIRSKGATSRARSRKRSGRCKRRSSSARLPRGVGRRVPGIHGVAHATPDRAADHAAADLRCSSSPCIATSSFRSSRCWAWCCPTPIGGIVALASRTRRSPSRLASAFSRCSASRCRPRWSTSPMPTSCALAASASRRRHAQAALLRLRPS